MDDDDCIGYINDGSNYWLLDRTFEDNVEPAVNYDVYKKKAKPYYISAERFMSTNVRIKYMGGEKYVESELSCSTHPHNTYIQLLAETGIVGFLFLLIGLFYFFKYLFKHSLLKFKSKYYFTDFEICILSGIAIYLWPFIPTGSVFTNWLSILMFLNLPFLIWSMQINK